MKFKHQISEETYNTQGLRQKGSFFYCTTLNFEQKLPKTALCADRHPLRRDTIASRDRFRPMVARQN